MFIENKEIQVKSRKMPVFMTLEDMIELLELLKTI